jgi:hypothetical protein
MQSKLILHADAKIMTSMPIKHRHDSTVSAPEGNGVAFPALHVWESMGKTTLWEALVFCGYGRISIKPKNASVISMGHDIHS